MEKQERNIVSKTEDIQSSVLNLLHKVFNNKWKYLIWLLLMYVNEYTMEFTRLESDDKKEIIAQYVSEYDGDFEVEKSRLEAKQQLNEISEYINYLELTSDEQEKIKEQIVQLSNFVQTNEVKGYEAGISHIREIEWFQWDLYFITDSFLILVLFLMLSYDGNRYYYFGDLEIPFMYGLVRLAFKASVLWGLYDLTSNILTRSERILKSEILIGVIILYLIFIIAAIWEDVRNEIFNRKKEQSIT